MSIVQFRVDDDLKNQASKIYEDLGLDLSTALRMFLKRTVMEKGIPFKMVLEEPYSYEEALAALKAVQQEAKAKGLDKMTLEEINEEINKARRGE